jgi:histidine triad (HIT) family protein
LRIRHGRRAFRWSGRTENELSLEARVRRPILRRTCARRFRAPPSHPVNYDASNVFARILRREIPARLLHEDHQCVAFADVAPQAPVHFLVIPKRAIARLADADESDKALLGHLLWAAAEVAKKLGIANDGFRVVINNGSNAGQSVFHLHVHVLAGRSFGWPPG